MTEIERHYKTQEVADLLGVHVRTVQAWIRTGAMTPVIMLSQRDYRVPASVVSRFISHRVLKTGLDVSA